MREIGWEGDNFGREIDWEGRQVGEKDKFGRDRLGRETGRRER